MEVPAVLERRPANLLVVSVVVEEVLLQLLR